MTAGKPCEAASIGDAIAHARLRAGRPGSKAGHVVGLFSSGFYVEIEEALFAVAGPAIHPGPIHLILAGAPPRPREKDPVFFDPDALRVGPFRIELSRARQYAPSLPTPSALRAVLPVLAGLRSNFPIPAELAEVAVAVEQAVAAGDLDAARIKLEGLGSGLTPSGDDVLAGLLLVACWRDPSNPQLGQMSTGTATTRLSRAFLRWAAAGQSILPVHQMLEAARQMARPGADALRERLRFDDAVSVLAQVGASSGKALLAGLSLAAQCARRCDKGVSR